jgi:hypothetical protein
MRLASLLVLPLVATGCFGNDNPTSLADVDDLRVIVDSYASTDGAVSQLTIHIAGSDDCIRAAPGFVAFMTGIGERTVRRGDESEDFCDTPSIDLRLSREARLPSQVLRVSDESLEVVIELGDLLMPRTAALATPADGVVRSGAPLAITWAPATELDDTGFRAEIAPFELDLDADPSGLLRGMVPGTLPASGPQQLRVIGELDAPLACSNAECSASLGWIRELAVEIAR